MAQAQKKLTQQDTNQAAELLVSQLPEHISQLIYVIAKENDIELWHLVCGILLEVYSTGQMSAFQIDPQWLDGLRQTTLICQECKKIFTPVNINQKYCTNECGTKALLAQSNIVPITKEVSHVEHNPDPEPDIVQPLSHPVAGSIDSGWTEILEDIK